MATPTSLQVQCGERLFRREGRHLHCPGGDLCEFQVSIGPSLPGTGNPAWKPLLHGLVSIHSVAFLPYLESVFEEVFKLLEVSG